MFILLRITVFYRGKPVSELLREDTESGASTQVKTAKNGFPSVFLRKKGISHCLSLGP